MDDDDKTKGKEIDRSLVHIERVVTARCTVHIHTYVRAELGLLFLIDSWLAAKKHAPW